MKIVVSRAIRGCGRVGAVIALACGVVAAAVGQDAPFATPAALPHVVFPPIIELAHLGGSGDLTVFGPQPFEQFGASVGGCGDVNGDGAPDLIIGAPYSKQGGVRTGAAYVVFGRRDIGASDALDLASLDGADGFVIPGKAQADSMGAAVSGAGDVNGDGVDDLLIGAPNAEPNNLNSSGVVYVVFGAPGLGASGTFDVGGLDGTNGFIVRGTYLSQTGASVAGGSDVNADGYPDLILGATGKQTSEAYVLFGGPGVGATGEVDLGSLISGEGVAFTDSGASRTGASVASGGDLNGDGIADIVIGAPEALVAGHVVGAAYVLFGSPTLGVSTTVVTPSALDGRNGFAARLDEAGSEVGTSVAIAGDINGDGLDDLVIGAPGVEVPGLANAGAVFAVFGAPRIGRPGSVDLGSLNGSNGFSMLGASINPRLGASVAGAGDVNGDGVADFLVGAPQLREGFTSVGGAYAVFGRAGIGASGSVDLDALDGSDGFRAVGAGVNPQVGISVCSGGDVNRDGVDDVVIGGPYWRGLEDRSGGAFVIFGRHPHVSPNFCPADIDGSLSVDAADFNIFAAHFGEVVVQGTDGDLTGDGVVDVADFSVLAADFGCGAP